MATVYDSAFHGAGWFADFIALLEEWKLYKPITGREVTFDEACNTHFPPLPDWFVNGLALIILLYALSLHGFIG